MIAATYIARYLREIGIKHVLGYDGSMMLKIADEISLIEGIDFIQGFHEQASSFAADAYARVSGVPGVVLVTSGPGAINALAGIADAYMDSVPLVVITGQDYSNHVLENPGVRLNGFQDLDVVSIVKPITKYAVQIMDVNRLAYELEKCFHIAMDGRKGPTLIDIPIDVQFREIPKCMEHFCRKDIGKLDISSVIHNIDHIISLLANAKKPVILAGGGIRLANAEDELRELAVLTNIPVVTTLNGHDAYEGAIGSSGLNGSPEANLTIFHSDLLLVLGARLGQQQVGKKVCEYTRARVIHVDIDPMELGRILTEEISICMDIKKFLQLINDKLSRESKQEYSDWWEKIDRWGETYEEELFVNKEGIDPVRFVRRVCEMCEENTIFTNDVGQNTMWVCQGLLLRRTQRLLTSSGYASMGFSVPAAIGAKIANPSRMVVSFSGDGGFHMNLQELQFVKLHQLNIKFIVFNNNTLGLMREVQHLYYNDNHVGSNINEFICADLKRVADLYDLQYLCINDPSEIENITTILSSPQAGIIDCRLSMNTCLHNWNKFKQEHPEELEPFLLGDER